MNIALQVIWRIVVLTVHNPGFKQQLAARELRRGLWQLGYRAPVILAEQPGPEVEAGELRVELHAGRSSTENYRITNHDGTVRIVAEGAQGLLYAIFDFLERQGAYFGIDGEQYPVQPVSHLVVPDKGQAWLGQPRFATRGLLPWPDFLNCITVYNREDFRAYLEAMLRMRFNTLGIHVYAQTRYWVEPFLSTEYGGVGHAAYADTTATDRWGYLPQRTSRYSMSAAQYFDGEVFGSDATRLARSPWEAAERSQSLWREAFDYAEKLGIRTGVGFELYQLPEEIVRACPPEVRTAIRRSIPLQDGGELDMSFLRVDPASRNARYILESRLAQLLEAYPSVDYIYLWEDEFTNWQSQKQAVETPVEPFRQAHDFLHRHAPDKRLVIGGWGGVARNFERFHRELPEDIIFTALSDQLGWDPVHEVFSKLGSRERWPIPWIEDDPSMWFPQLLVNRFRRDMKLAEDYGCQGMLGIHWRHRIVDPVAGYLSRRSWNGDLQPADHYQAYARTQVVDERRAHEFADWLLDVDTHYRFLQTWTGRLRDDDHHETQEFAGDYGEAFVIERSYTITDEFVAQQAAAIETLRKLLESATSPLEQERLGYWYGQSKFLDPYARAWQVGQKLQRLISEQYKRKQSRETDADSIVCEQGIPLYVELSEYVREAVLAFQHTVATRNDLGMLASIHNKFVRIAAFRMRMALLEFMDVLPAEAEAAFDAALAPDISLEGSVIVPTRPTRLERGEQVRITAIAPGTREITDVTLYWRRTGATNWRALPMQLAGRRTYTANIEMLQESIEYYVAATFAGMPATMRVTAPREGAYLITG
jgi:hypothetical protein